MGKTTPALSRTMRAWGESKQKKFKAAKEAKQASQESEAAVTAPPPPSPEESANMGFRAPTMQTQQAPIEQDDDFEDDGFRRRTSSRSPSIRI